MKFVSDRELRNIPGKVREALAQGDVVITSRGKPYAIMMPLSDPDRLDDLLKVTAQVKAQLALANIRRKFAEAGDAMSDEEIEDEIKAARQDIRGRRS